jgi:methyltransferase (TIGR00027 family)
MSESGPVIRNISDTALWAAYHRAHESERPDALFHDPLARRLAGDRGEQIAALFPEAARHEWAWAARTFLGDRSIREQVQQGFDMVLNLAAGLDTRPYRMDLPKSLRWVEVDLPDLLDYKEQILAGETPLCSLERVRLDLSDANARRQLFERLGSQAKNVLISTEGLLMYLSSEQVASLARDLAGPQSFRRWMTELCSPGLLRLLQRELQPQLDQGGARVQFGPTEGPAFFLPYGWKTLDVHSLLKTAARLGRLSFWMRLMALLPESKGEQGSRPWSAMCVFERA